jgi:multiple sugar transport system substrate-binding protein
MKSSHTINGLLASCVILIAGAVRAESDWRSFPKAVVEPMLIGGQQYEGPYVDIGSFVSEDTITKCAAGNTYTPAKNGELLALQCAQFDVSELGHLKSNSEGAKQAAMDKAQYNQALTVSETWPQVKDQAIFYGTNDANRYAALVYQPHEVAATESDKCIVTLNSDWRALPSLIGLDEAQASATDTSLKMRVDLGQGVIKGSTSADQQWQGSAGFSNDAKSSKAAGIVSVTIQPLVAVTRAGWSDHFGFLATNGSGNK